MAAGNWLDLLKGTSSKSATASLLQRADAANAVHNWAEAARLYEQVLKADPTKVAIWIQLGHCRKEMGDIDSARSAYVTASELAPGQSEAYFHLAHMLRFSGDMWGGYENFLKAFEADGNPEAEKELGLMLGSEYSYPETIRMIDEVFTTEDYLELNGDIASAGVDPRLHYLLFGWKEKRSPSHIFDPWYYERQYRNYLKPGTMPLLHYVKNRSKGFRGNALSDKRWFTAKAPESDAWDALSPAILGKKTRAVVILPVYKGYDETLASVYHALSARGDAAYSLLVINDCGPDKKLNAELARLGEKGLFDYHLSEKNRGFVQTCNHAIADLSGGLDVVLLNSDAFVFPGWFERMIAHADKDPSVATITPLSNNATLCSYPLRDKNNLLSLECTPAEMNDIAGRANAGVAVEAPTGVGFCFYMRRSVIEEIGALDPVAFKVGYGEENDFCMRSLNAGYKNLLACDVFTFHVGSVSFSSSKAENFDAGQKALLRKHPNYPSLVRHHFEADPALTARRTLDRARLIDMAKGAALMVTHNWGGGIDTYLKDKAAEFSLLGTKSLMMKVHDSHMVSFSQDDIYVPNLVDIDMRTEMAFVLQLLADLSPSRIMVNSFAGLTWEFHSALLASLSSLSAEKTLVLHDYSAITHHYQLIRPDQIYAGLPTMADLRQWALMKNPQATDPCDPDIRHAAYNAFLVDAKVESPSKASAEIFRTFFPKADIRVVPHEETWDVLPDVLPRRPDGQIRISLIGAIGSHKGSDILLALANDSRDRYLGIDYSVVGYTNNDEALAKADVEITGAYTTNEEAFIELERIQPDMIFIPSVWPETFCYTLSIALKTGVPTVVFDLGAQADRIREAGTGHILDPKLINSPTALSDALLALAETRSQPATTAAVTTEPARKSASL
ncbi:GT2 family glycosyltransferase [Rhizobium sp. PP-F2F-G36]|nr:GT2 family glycosyltransferase [Rhizobium sp. PP-F2F-G36]